MSGFHSGKFDLKTQIGKKTKPRHYCHSDDELGRNMVQNISCDGVTLISACIVYDTTVCQTPSVLLASLLFRDVSELLILVSF